MVAFKEFKEALEANPELAGKYIDAQKTLLENKAVSSKTELFVKSAAEVGFELNPEEVERAFATGQPLSEEELANVSGSSDNNCAFSFYCNYVFVCDTTAKGLEILDTIF